MGIMQKFVGRVSVKTLVNASRSGLTAHAGGGQTSGLQLSYGWNRITTVGTGADSLKLPIAKAGTECVVCNAAAANSTTVYPSSGQIINALSADSGLAVAANKVISFKCFVDGTWNSQLTA